MFVTVFIIATMSFVLLVPFVMVLVLVAGFARRSRPQVLAVTARTPDAVRDRRVRAAA